MTMRPQRSWVQLRLSNHCALLSSHPTALALQYSYYIRCGPWAATAALRQHTLYDNYRGGIDMDLLQAELEDAVGMWYYIVPANASNWRLFAGVRHDSWACSWEGGVGYHWVTTCDSVT